jgi:hypothetical protein
MIAHHWITKAERGWRNIWGRSTLILEFLLCPSPFKRYAWNVAKKMGFLCNLAPKENVCIYKGLKFRSSQKKGGKENERRKTDKINKNREAREFQRQISML